MKATIKTKNTAKAAKTHRHAPLVHHILSTMTKHHIATINQVLKLPKTENLSKAILEGKAQLTAFITIRTNPPVKSMPYGERKILFQTKLRTHSTDKVLWINEIVS